MKKILIVILSMLFLFIGVKNVEAALEWGGYNGGVGSMTPSGGGDCKDSWSYCTWDDRHFTAVQLKLVYYNAKTKTTTLAAPKPYFIVNSGRSGANLLHYNNLVESGGGEVLLADEINDCYQTKGGDAGPYDGCTYNYAWLKERYSDYAGNKAQAEKNVLSLIRAMGVNPQTLNLKNDDGIGIDNSGYRILVEPLLYFKDKGVQKYATIKQAFASNEGTSNSKEWEDQSWILHTEFDDIGIWAPFGKSSIPAEIRSETAGYGLHIINPVRSVFETCYKLTVKEKNPVCKNTNKQNSGYYEETFTEISCESGDVEKNANEYGKLTKTLNENCKIYCTERVDVAYPGHVSPQVKLGTNFVWPTFGAGRKHNLDIVGKKTCKVVGNSCSLSSVDKKSLYGNFKSKVMLTFEQLPDYKNNKPFSLEEASHDFICDGCEGLWDGKDITVTHRVSLKLPKNKYRYVDKVTTIAYDSASKRRTDIGYGNLPVSRNAIITLNTGKPKQYNLTLSNFELGENKQFSEKARKANYTCKYSLSTTTSESCTCPIGTYDEGKDLYGIIYSANKKGEKMTCAAAQATFCDGPGPKKCVERCIKNLNKNKEYCELYCDESFCESLDEKIDIKQCQLDGKTKEDCTAEKCPESPKYCPEPNQHISIQECVLSGQDPDYCIAKNCPSTPPPDNPDPKLPDKYQCPENTPHAYMDITGCVESLIAKGETESNAIKTCQDIVCPLNGIPIIYRTISLKNPFPSKSLNGKVEGFNTDVKGRYPGANWNSKALVQAEILENRGVKDNEVYKKEPLYKFTLDSKTISTIRTYNKSQKNKGGYSDFTLTCKDGSKCISKFLRNTIKIQSGTCKSSSVNTFDSCVD